MARQMTENLYDALMMDTGVGIAAATDFGIGYSGSEQHSALQRAVRSGATVEELDEVLGNGEKIAELVKKYTEIELSFKTPYDELRNEVKRQIVLLGDKEVLTEAERTELNILCEGYKAM
jgi:hypothetical protein